jgi:hypothetical protein
MTTGLQLALGAGALVSLGVVLLVMRLMPAEPDLAEALGRLTPTRSRAHLLGTASATSGKERAGVWAMKTLPAAMWVRTPTRELAILRIPLAQFYGDKLAFAGLGLVIPPLLAWFFDLIGLGLPIAVPPLASLGLAALMFFMPNYTPSMTRGKPGSSSPERLARTSTSSLWSGTTAPGSGRRWSRRPKWATRGSSVGSRRS